MGLINEQFIKKMLLGNKSFNKEILTGNGFINEPILEQSINFIKTLSR